MQDLEQRGQGGLLAGKVALVTGGLSGIGRAIARGFVEAGATVIVADLSVPEGAVDSCDTGEAHRCDVADEASVKALAEALSARHEGLDILVNCAGMPQKPVPLAEASVAEWDRLFAVNARSVFVMTKHFLPALARRRGNVINICSTVGAQAKPGLAAYGASKAAAIATTKALALELAGQGIRVNGISPGAVETPMLTGFADGDPAEIKAAFARLVPLGEIVQPDDVAGAALYLGSSLGRLVTGVIITVDGGRTA